MPTPPAAFSPFTTTKSGWWRVAESGQQRGERSPADAAHHVADEEELHAGDSANLRAVETTTATLEAEGLVKRYGDREALRGVSLAARPGELVAVIGPNGAGKTTLLSILAGIQRPTRARSPSRPRRSAGCRSRPALYGKLTVEENLRCSRGSSAAPDPRATVERMLELTDLRDRAGRPGGRALRRQPPAREHRHRPAGRAGRAAARRAERRARPAPARAPVGVHPAPRRGRHDGHLRHAQHPGGRPLRQPADRARRRRAAVRRLAARARAARSAPRGLDFEEAFVEFLHRRGH